MEYLGFFPPFDVTVQSDPTSVITKHHTFLITLVEIAPASAS